MPSLNFRVQGEGPSILLLHGFPFNQAVWRNFAERLRRSFKVYALDLPGFGQSPLPGETISIDSVAQLVLQWIQQEQVQTTIVIGHSLGGYVALSMMEQMPEQLLGVVLFHSTASADSEEKKASREKVLQFIDNNGVEAFTTNFIEPLFLNPKTELIPWLKEIASSASSATVKAYTAAMRDRPDRTNVLSTFNKPVLFLTGRHDAGISVASIQDQADGLPLVSCEILENSAHMGMFEESEIALKKIEAFIEHRIVTNREHGV